MNVLFVVDSLSAGGAGRVVARLSSYFQEQGVCTSVLPVFDNAVTYNVDSGVRIFRTFEKPLEHAVSERIALIRDAARSAEADVVVSFLSFINLYAIAAGIGSKWKTVVSERNNPYTYPDNKKIRIVRKCLYLLADGYVFQTNDARDYFSKPIRAASRVIANPVADDIPEPYGGVRSKRIVSAGRLTRQKNYPMALTAMAKVLQAHPDYVYEIYGDGEEKESLLDLIRQLKLEKNVFLMGHSTKLLSAIRDASVFVLSSDYEGMSNSLIEALALGLPVVSTDHPTGGARMLIENGKNGLLVPVGDAEALTAAVCSLIEHPAAAESIGKAAAKIREDHSIEVIGDRWLDYLSSLSGK